MSSTSSCSVTPFSMARGKWKLICSVLPVATSAAQVIRLRSRFESCGRSHTSPKSTFSVISTSFGAKSASGFFGVPMSNLLCASGVQERLDRAAFVHRAVSLPHLLEGQRQVEDLAGVDLPARHQLDQLGEKAPHRGGATVEVDVGEEELLPVELHPVRDTDVRDVVTRACRTDRLRHRLLGANAFQHRVGADSLGELLDAGHAGVTALGDDLRRTELAGELLPWCMTAHRD